MKASEFNEKLGKDGYVFLSSIDDEIVILGAFIEKLSDVDKLLGKFLK